MFDDCKETICYRVQKSYNDIFIVSLYLQVKFGTLENSFLIELEKSQ